MSNFQRRLTLDCQQKILPLTDPSLPLPSLPLTDPSPSPMTQPRLPPMQPLDVRPSFPTPGPTIPIAMQAKNLDRELSSFASEVLRV